MNNNTAAAAAAHSTAATTNLSATIIRAVSSVHQHRDFLLTFPRGMPNYIYIPYRRARNIRAKPSVYLNPDRPQHIRPFFCRGCSASAVNIIGPVFFTSRLPPPTSSPPPSARSFRLLLSHRGGSNIEFTGEQRRSASLCSALRSLSRVPPPANLMTPRIIVRLLTGEKWPFTCGKI